MGAVCGEHFLLFCVAQLEGSAMKLALLGLWTAFSVACWWIVDTSAARDFEPPQLYLIAGGFFSLFFIVPIWIYVIESWRHRAARREP
jgi:hypothetical protein